MADKDRKSDPADDLDERIDTIARVVKDYLREGDAFLVQCLEDDIVVEEAPPTRLLKEHPRLYGRLLSMEDQLETGCGLTIALFVLGGMFCLGLYVGWWEALLPPNVIDALTSWWFFVPLFVALFCLSDIAYTQVTRRAYRRGRAELLALMREEGFDRDTLVPIIISMGEFGKITRQLKLDPGPFRVEE